jgi:hypothetical protein
MTKYRITLDATIVPVTDTALEYYHAYQREQWRVTHARTTFDFETKESLAAFLLSFGKLLGTE